MEETFSFKDLLKLLKKRFNLILLVTFILVLISSVFSYYNRTPIINQAVTQILIKAKDSQNQFFSNDAQTDSQLINTSKSIIKSPVILDKVIDYFSLNMTDNQLNKKIVINNEPNSQVINIYVQDPDARQAVEIADKIAQVSQTEIKKLLDVESINIIAKAKATIIQSPGKSKPVQNILIAFVVGLMLGIAITFILNYIDTSFKNGWEIHQLLGMVFLGDIGIMEDNHNQGKVNFINRTKSISRRIPIFLQKNDFSSCNKPITTVDPKSSVSEQYRTIRTNIQLSAVDRESRTIMISSSGSSEGKTTTASNLAITFAQQGKKVLLVDANLRRPTIHCIFNLSNSCGFSNVLTKQANFKKAIQETDIGNLSILTSGPIPPNPAELLSSKEKDQFFADTYGLFDIIIFDTPPVTEVTDAQILANKCDGTILVVHCRKTEKEPLIKAKELLELVQGNILGFVLNCKEA